MNRRLPITLLLLAAAPLSLWFALSQGSLNINAVELWRALLGDHNNATAYLVIHELRLPRALSAFAWRLLALSGLTASAVAQSARGSVCARHLGRRGGRDALSMLAVSARMVARQRLPRCHAFHAHRLRLSRAGAAWTQNRLLLTGVVVAAGWGAVISLILAVARRRRFKECSSG